MSYQQVFKESEKRLFKEDRFVTISEREDKCDLSSSAWHQLIASSYHQSWRGIILNKGITEIAMYPMLLNELKPKTVIEIGALKGASAVWIADNLEIFGVESNIYSMDIDLSLLDEKAKSDSRINFIEGDSNNIDAVFSPDKLSGLPHPWLVIEDAHVNLIGVLEYFHSNGLQPGDYLIVEDTNLFMWDYWQEHWDKQLIEEQRYKMLNLRRWLENHEDEYLVDTYYQDVYGYNVSKNWNSILKKVK